MREFICIKCGHKVVVNPKLPADYTPTTCTPCWDADEPERRARDQKTLLKTERELRKLLRLLGIDDKKIMPD